MKTIEKINGITAEVERSGFPASNRWAKYSSLEEMVKDMTSRDVIYKFANVNGESITVKLTKTNEAIENAYENDMRIKNKDFPQPDLPTDMYL